MGFNYGDFLLNFFPNYYQKRRFKRKVGYWPNTQNPTKIREILFKLKQESSIKDAKFVDKTQVGEIVQKLVKEHNLELGVPQLLGIYNTIDEIDFDTVNEECFIKANHSSGHTLFFNPKEYNLNSIKESTKDWLSIDYGKIKGEKCYSGVHPKIMLEKKLDCKLNEIPDDIKVHCFFGKPVIIQVLRRTKGYLERATFDVDWKKQNWFENEVLDVSLEQIPQEKVLENAKILSKDFKYVRIDFYNVDGKLYFGEYTFFPNSSHLKLSSDEVDIYLGEIYKQIESEL